MRTHDAMGIEHISKISGVNEYQTITRSNLSFLTLRFDTDSFRNDSTDTPTIKYYLMTHYELSSIRMVLVFPSFTYSYHPMFVSLDTDSDGFNISVFITEVGVYLLFLVM